MSRLLLTPLSRLRRRADRLRGVERSTMTGRVVLVTGASSGIGAATSRAVARRGAHVIMVARRVAELAAGAAAIRTDGGSAEVHVVDLTDTAAVDALVEEVLGKHSAVDYLVNNAGRSIRRSLSLTQGRLHDFDRTMALNFFAPVRLTMGLLPAMRAQQFGHVVNILTWGVQLKAPKFAAYISSKAALDTWARIAGRETWDDNVTFTNMRLGLVRTAMVVPTDSYEDRRSLSADQAAEKVVRALEDRPVTVNTLAGSLGEVANIAAPRLSDAVFAVLHRRFPDSAAARSTSTGVDN